MLTLTMLMTAVSVASAPTLLPGSGFATGNPPSIAQSARTGFVGVHVTVDAKGLPHDCVVLSSSSNQGLDTKICESAVAEMHFTPARDPAGHPVAGVYVGYIGWTKTSPDLAADQPSSTTIPGRAVLLMTTTADGVVDECRIEPQSDLGPTTLGCNLAKSLPFAAVLRRPMTAIKAVRVLVHVQLRPGFNPVRQVNAKVTAVVYAADLTVGHEGNVIRCTPRLTLNEPEANLIDPCAFVAKTPFPNSPDASRTGTVSLFVVGVAR